MFYGKKTNETTYGSYLDNNELETYVEIDDGEWMNLVEEANSTGKLIEPDEEGHPTLVNPPEPTEQEKAKQKIYELKKFLSETDYIACKIAEGEATKEEYADILQKRKNARTEINECEKTLAQ